MNPPWLNSSSTSEIAVNSFRKAACHPLSISSLQTDGMKGATHTDSLASAQSLSNVLATRKLCIPGGVEERRNLANRVDTGVPERLEGIAYGLCLVGRRVALFQSGLQFKGLICRVCVTQISRWRGSRTRRAAYISVFRHPY